MSSIPRDSPWRGCAAHFDQPLSEEGAREAQHLAEAVHHHTCRGNGSRDSPSPSNILYRPSNRDQDILRHVFLWERTSDNNIDKAFRNGIEARREESVSDDTYYNLNHYAQHRGGPRLHDSRERAAHAFLSATLDCNRHPRLSAGCWTLACRYEIYAPGGILVAETLKECGHWENVGLDEVCFVGGIAPQYIRSAQMFLLPSEASSRYERWERSLKERLLYNVYFNPQSHPYMLLNIQSPVSDFITDDGYHRRLSIERVVPTVSVSEIRRRISERNEISDEATNWYSEEVANVPVNIDAAFRSSKRNEAYIFMRNEYAVWNYAPGTYPDMERIKKNPLLISQGFSSLAVKKNKRYHSDGDNAFIFCGNLCALIDYAPEPRKVGWRPLVKALDIFFSLDWFQKVDPPRATDDRILSGPVTIAAMFPFLRGTVFENGIDAAFRSSASQEAYLFKDHRYALINYRTKTLVASIGDIGDIAEGFRSLEGTVFASGIDVAFASHKENEAYIFKGDEYAVINFADVGTTNDCNIIGGVKSIGSTRPVLRGLLSRMNRGLDAHDHLNLKRQR